MVLERGEGDRVLLSLGSAIAVWFWREERAIAMLLSLEGAIAVSSSLKGRSRFIEFRKCDRCLVLERGEGDRVLLSLGSAIAVWFWREERAIAMLLSLEGAIAVG